MTDTTSYQRRKKLRKSIRMAQKHDRIAPITRMRLIQRAIEIKDDVSRAAEHEMLVRLAKKPLLRQGGINEL